jgi:hypothetical protein
VSRVRNSVYNVGVALKEGIYIVPRTRGQELIETVRQLREEYRSTAQEFAREWPAVLSSMEAKIIEEHGHDTWLKVTKLLPSEEEIPSLFDVEVGVWPISGGGGAPIVSTSLMSSIQEKVHALENGDPPEEVSELLEEVRELCSAVRGCPGKLSETGAEEWLGEAQRATERMVAQAVDAMVSEPVQEFAAAVSNLEALQARGTCRGSTLESVRRAYEKLQGFRFMLPSDLTDRLREAENRLNMTEARDVNAGSAIAATLTRQLRSVTDDLNNEVSANNRRGSFFRNLEI